MARKRLLNSRFGNRGQIFVLDAFLAVVIVILILGMALFIASSADTENLALANLNVIGSDILALLDHDGSLVSLSEATIRNNKNLLLDNNVYAMKIAVYQGRELVVETTENLPDDRNIFSGSRITSIENGGNFEYYTTKYWIWLR